MKKIEDRVMIVNVTRWKRLELARLGLSCAVLATVLSGCALEYEYRRPRGKDLRELERLTRADLSVDTAGTPRGADGKTLVVPFRDRHGEYFVDVEINGEPADLILDWGSWTTLGLMPHTVIGSEAALSDAVIETRTLDGEGEMRTGLVRDLRIGGLEVHDVPFTMSNRDLTVKLNGVIPVYRGKGMLGLPFLAAFDRFAIDLANRKLHLGELPSRWSEDRPGDRVITVPFRFDEGIHVDGSVDGVPVDLRVDVGGFSGPIMLLDEAADAFMRGQDARFVGHSTGFGDRARERYAARVDRVRIGAHERRDVTVLLLPSVPESEGAPTAEEREFRGLVGNRFFGETTIAVEWTKRRLSFVVEAAPPTRSDAGDTAR